MSLNTSLDNEVLQEIMSKFLDPDNVTNQWLLTRSPWPVLACITVYLMVIYKLGPMFMEGKDAYSLQFVMRLYNIVQVLCNGYISFKIFIPVPGIPPLIYIVAKASCTIPSEPLEGLDYLQSMFMYIGWLFLVLKILDLFDTVFMVLRKKSSQMTFLHVYHHVATVFFYWFSLSRDKAVLGTFPVILNAMVHTIMYLYYFLATFDSLKPPLWWKKAITKIQLGQFVVVLVYLSTLYYYDCQVSRSLMIIWQFNVSVVFLLFINFYIRSYLSPKEKGLKIKEKSS